MKEGILPHIEKLNVVYGDGFINHQLRTAGGRILTVTLWPDPGNLRAETVVSARKEHIKLPGSTTALYTQAKEIMQQTANRRSEVLTYTFSTHSQAMINWALTDGQKLFDWEDPHTPVPGEQFELHSKFFPKI